MSKAQSKAHVSSARQADTSPLRKTSAKKAELPIFLEFKCPLDDIAQVVGSELIAPVKRRCWRPPSHVIASDMEFFDSDRIRTEALCFFDAFSSREPASTSLENATVHRALF
jgi:hypothetical protein